MLDSGTLYGDTCSGDGGYSDMREGAQVIVYDDAQKIIGTGGLRAGKPLGVRPDPPIVGVPPTYSGCQFAFEVANLPRPPFYQVEIGKRGRQTIQQADVDKPLSLSLG